MFYYIMRIFKSGIIWLQCYMMYNYKNFLLYVKLWKLQLELPKVSGIDYKWEVIGEALVAILEREEEAEEVETLLGADYLLHYLIMQLTWVSIIQKVKYDTLIVIIIIRCLTFNNLLRTLHVIYIYVPLVLRLKYTSSDDDVFLNY